MRNAVCLICRSCSWSWCLSWTSNSLVSSDDQTLVVLVTCLKVYEGATSILEVDEGAEVVVAVYLSDAEDCELGSTI